MLEWRSLQIGDEARRFSQSPHVDGPGKIIGDQGRKRGPPVYLACTEALFPLHCVQWVVGASDGTSLIRNAVKDRFRMCCLIRHSLSVTLGCPAP